jgi:hypothetical protein
VCIASLRALFFNFRFAMPETGSTSTETGQGSWAPGVPCEHCAQASTSSAAKEQLLETDAVVLLSPGVRQSPGKTSDGNTCRGSTFNERRDDPGRYEGEGSQ